MQTKTDVLIIYDSRIEFIATVLKTWKKVLKLSVHNLILFITTYITIMVKLINQQMSGNIIFKYDLFL